ncbi:glycosyltransferase family 4 protein [Acholeplasma vituli]|uniref:Glycosyltransferase family 4 protein n=1 Tax=Paracholeplasma vituli TaxID=69473 RepID=A0ABT2PT96_9MOLU|nr:glycosyltransferase family 4 protein [Paracholeplasma vituli]MCU0104171.1 glycosyltransferase family 4 protein [Paracholeplasma vituli]
MNKHILVVTQYYYPENFRINDITKEWVKRGYKVTVVTGIPNYPKGRFFKGYGFFKKRKEVIDGVKVIRLALIPRFNNSIFLALNYLSFMISGWFWAKFTRIKADLVFNFEVSPMTQALPAIWFAKRRKIPSYIYVTDLWPESVIFATKIKNKFIINRIVKMVDSIYKRCTKILVSSQGFVEPIHKRNIEKSKIIYWPQYAEDIYKPLPVGEHPRKLPNDGLLNVIFTGNIGYAQGLSILVDASKSLKEKNVKVRFNLVGDGRYYNKLLKEVEDEGVEQYFNFLGRKNPSDIPSYLAESDVTFISLENEEVFNITLPSKTQTYLACGKPLIVSANGVLHDLIRDNNCGYCSNSRDVEGLVQNIIRYSKATLEEKDKLRKSCIELSNKVFNKDILMNELESIIKGDN